MPTLEEAIAAFLKYKPSYYLRRKQRQYLNLPPKIYKPKREIKIYTAFYPSKDEDFLKNIDIRTIIENYSSDKHDIFIKEYCDLSKRFKQPINWINSMDFFQLITETDRYNLKLRLRMMRIIFRSVNNENLTLKNEIIDQIALLEKIKNCVNDTKPKKQRQPKTR